MEEALMALLLGYPPLTARFGNRISWDGFVQGAGSPAIALFKISAAPGYTNTGEDGLDRARVQIDIRELKTGHDDQAAQTRAVHLGRMVRKLLSGYRGKVAGTRFSGIFLLSERAGSDHSGAELYHRVSMDFEVWSSPAG